MEVSPSNLDTVSDITKVTYIYVLRYGIYTKYNWQRAGVFRHVITQHREWKVCNNSEGHFFDPFLCPCLEYSLGVDKKVYCIHINDQRGGHEGTSPLWAPHPRTFNRSRAPFLPRMGNGQTAASAFLGIEMENIHWFHVQVNFQILGLQLNRLEVLVIRVIHWDDKLHLSRPVNGWGATISTWDEIAT